MNIYLRNRYWQILSKIFSMNTGSTGQKLGSPLIFFCLYRANSLIYHFLHINDHKGTAKIEGLNIFLWFYDKKAEIIASKKRMTKKSKVLFAICSSWCKGNKILIKVGGVFVSFNTCDRLIVNAHVIIIIDEKTDGIKIFFDI